MVTLVGLQFKYGPQDWKLVGDKWFVLMFGTSGPGQNPHYFWSEISESKVPNELLLAAKRQKGR